ncbi:MmgE/PrpD family protein [Adlercreutzia sp. ZJ138]|uniref:MmgE/PrpD family protein n=1 Tax=Adlercreutzia sp. ZJ138 TaxID=2709405 RepID=UPI0013EA1974|nr:MmgE/PrpD family protein [Adlercreutzia sp. ZJ138]
MQFLVNDYSLEQYALDLRWKDIPNRIQNRVLMCSIDLMTALVLGSRSNQFECGLKLAQSLGLRGELPVVGEANAGLNFLGASIVMGHASNSFDIDDGFNLIKGHPGASFVGGTLAAALDVDADYEDYLVTLAICYEVGIRWALAMQKHYNYLHSTGSYGAFATALGAGKLRRLSASQLKCALSIADFHAPMVPVMRAVEYPSMNKDGVPFGSLIGAMAVLETYYGVTGATHLLECPEFRYLVDTLGQRYYIEELYFKPYTCCRWAHQPIDACLKLMAECGFCCDDVERVTVHTFRSAAALSKKRPLDTDEAQYNISFPVACALVHGDVGYEQIRDEAVKDERVLDMMERLSFVIDDDLEALFPEKRKAWVEIKLKNGQMFCSEAVEAPGESTDPRLGLEWVENKFRRRTAGLISARGQNDIIGFLKEPTGSVKEMVLQINKAMLEVE